MTPVLQVVGAKMTDADYDREKRRLVEIYGEADAKTIVAAARRDQAFARFYHCTGWTQDRIAAKEGKSQRWVSYRLRFGRFLAFSANSTAVLNAQNLTEGRFRKYWDATGTSQSNENVGFRAVMRAMEADLMLQSSRARMGLGPQVMDYFADGQWHQFETIRDRLHCSDEDLAATLRWMENRGTHKSVVETKPYGASKMYRIMRREKMISSHELTTKLSPLVKAIMAEGKKTTARMSPPTVLHLASQIDRLISEWSE